MNMTEFSGNMKKAVEKKLGQGYSVEEVTISKNNDIKLEALVIRKEGINLSPTVYLASYFVSYENGESIKDVAGRLVRDFFAALPEGDIDVSFYEDYEKVKKGLSYKLISSERNEFLLESVPHVPFLDLEIVFYYCFEMNGLPEGTILIRNSHMERWGVDTGLLMKDALENAPNAMPGRCQRIGEFLDRMSGHGSGFITQDIESVPLYVVTNRQMSNGAATMLYPGLLKDLSDKLGRNLFLIPSSVHEIIAFADDGEEDTGCIKDMIFSINRTQVEPQDVLSDSLYYFDRDTGKITFAS